MNRRPPEPQCTATLFPYTTLFRSDTHVAMFAGETPCDARGQPLQRIINASRREELGGGLVVTHTFSSKPPVGAYADYYEKMTTYVALLRSEEHTSELQSLMRTSYAVFCLEKKKDIQTQHQLQ